MTNEVSINTKKNSLWIIEDNSFFRMSTHRALCREQMFDSVIGMGTCEEAIHMLDEGRIPQMVLMDIGLPGIDGIAGIEVIKSRVPDSTILVLTVFEDEDKIFKAMKAGASGYLLKSDDLASVVESIQSALDGGCPIHARVAKKILKLFNDISYQRKDYQLNEREKSVLECMTNGLSKKQIATKMSINLHTTDYIMRCIYRKLHVHGAAAAVALAVRERLIPNLNDPS
jgi:DNA-binding NarL/FixJ family response regulator